MSVAWSAQAITDLENIFGYIAQDNEPAAHELIDTVTQSVEKTLGDHPMLGRPGRVEGTREWVAHRSYVVEYHITSNGDVEVLAVIHAARLWPDAA